MYSGEITLLHVLPNRFYPVSKKEALFAGCGGSIREDTGARTNNSPKAILAMTEDKYLDFRTLKS